MPDEPVPDDWEATLADLEVRRAAGRAMGGEVRLAKHHAAGKLDARARDCRAARSRQLQSRSARWRAGRIPADAIVTGSGLIDGRPVMVGAEDFTTIAGTIGPISNSKRYRVAELALRQIECRCIMLLEGAGFRADGKADGRTPTDLIWPSPAARASCRWSPRCSVRRPGMGHWSPPCPTSAVMSAKGSVFTAGPPVVKESIGEDGHQGGARRSRHRGRPAG